MTHNVKEGVDKLGESVSRRIQSVSDAVKSTEERSRTEPVSPPKTIHVHKTPNKEMKGDRTLF